MRKSVPITLGILAGCAGASAPPAVLPPDPPVSIAEVDPEKKDTTPAAPPPACEVDTLRAFSADGSRLAVAHESGGILIYDTSSWVLAASLETTKLTRMFFAGRRLVFAEELAGKKDMYRVRVLDESLRPLFEVGSALTGWLGAELAANDDGSQVLLPVLDETRTPDNPEHVMSRVELWDVLAKKKLFEHALLEEEHVQKLVMGKTGNVLVGAGRLFFFPKGAQKPQKSWDYRADIDPVFSNSGAFLVFRKDNALEVYGIRDKKLRSLKDKDCDGQGAVWSPDDKTLATGGFSFHVCLFDPSTGRLRQTLPNPRVSSQAFEDEGMREPEEWSRDGRALVTKGLFEQIVFDVKAGQELDIVKLNPTLVGVGSWNQNDTRIRSRTRDGALVVLHQGRFQAHVLGGRLIGDVLDGEPLKQLGVSGDGERFLRATDRIEILTTDTRSPVLAVEGSEGDKDAYGDQAFWFDPSGKWLISGDGAVRVWSLSTGKRVGPKRDERCPAR